MPRFWIDIEDAAGNHLGSGPIITATSWESSLRLDAAGSFRFTMPASDPKSALLLRKRIARCYTERDGALVEVGAGIIDSVEKQIGNPTMLTVSGPDLLAELGTRTVHGLGVFDMDWVFLSDGRGSVRRLSNTDEWDLPEAYDGVYATSTADFDIRDDQWLYIGFDTRYEGIAYTINKTNDTRTATMQYQYYRSDNSWAGLAGVVDSTIISGRPFAQNGTVTFTPQTDWARTTPTLASGSWFWIRCRRQPGVGNNFTISLYEVRVYSPIPTTDGVNMIMAYAPPGWVNSGYPQTDAEHYLVFDGASVLSALIALCEQGGQDGGEAIREHFRLGTGREIDWLGTATPHSGIRAVQRTNTPEAPELCQIADLSVKDDASEVVTRVYPVSQDGVTLALTDRTPPTGYTLSAGGNYVEHDAGVAAFGRIERVERFGEIAAHQEGSWLVLPRMVANALFDRTVEYLRTRAVEQSYYALSVVDLSETLLPGQQVDVVYHDYVDGYHVVDIDDTLTLLGTTVRIDERGVTTVALEVATIDRQPQTDAGVVVDLVKRSQLPGATGGALGFVVVPGEPATPPEIVASWDPGAAESLLKTNDAGWLNLVRLYLDELHAELGADLVVQLGDDTGGTRLSITDSAGAEVAAVDSDGNATLRTVLPDGNNLWSLGADATRWANIWASYFEAHNATINSTLSVGGTSYLGHVLPHDPGTYDLGQNAWRWRKLYINELSGAKVGGDLIPTLTDAYDLGSASKLWRRGYLSELRAVLFAEETIQLVGGWLIVPKDAGTFEADVADTDLTIDFGKAMTPGHWVLVRSYDASTGMPAAEYLTVGSLVSGTTYNVTRNVDGSGANDWAAGTPFLVLGEEGDGRIELNAYDTPRIQILQQGAAYNLADEVVRIGDLDGAFGITEERYGFGVGDYAAKNYLRYDPTDGFLLSAGGGEIAIDETGITIGYDADAAFRLEADVAGTKHDVMYHDADADALHLESATQYWELAENLGAKLAADGSFFKFQERPNTELVSNGGFEIAGSGGEVFDDWAFAGTDGSVSDETVAVHSGSHAAKVTSGASKNASISQTITAPFALAGYTIVLSFWTRGGGSYAGRYFVWGNGYNGYIIGTTSTGVPGTTYTKVTVTFTCPAGTTSIVVALAGPDSIGAYALFDDVSVAISWGRVNVALGSAAKNWAILEAQANELILRVGDASTLDGQVGWVRQSYYSDGSPTKIKPIQIYVGVDIPAGKYCDIARPLASYVLAQLACFNASTGAFIGHLFTGLAKPSSGNVDRYFTSDKTYVYAESGEIYLRLRADKFLIVYNGSAVTVKVIGTIMYFE